MAHGGEEWHPAAVKRVVPRGKNVTVVVLRTYLITGVSTSHHLCAITIFSKTLNQRRSNTSTKTRTHDQSPGIHFCTYNYFFKLPFINDNLTFIGY